MSTTPIFDQTLLDHPPTLWMTANVFPWPPHESKCPFDGYNWHVCTCPTVNAMIELMYGSHWRLDIPKAGAVSSSL